jgi:hypothetical protein
MIQKDDQWEMIFSATKLYRAEILKALLEEENIPSVIINKQDSSYLIFGEIEVYVRRDDILQAKTIVNRFLTSE